MPVGNARKCCCYSRRCFWCANSMPTLKKVEEKLQHVTLHASWISGLSIKMDHKNVSQIDFNNTSLTIQKGKYYFFKLCSYCNSKRFSWNEAQKHCENQGGILPEIFSRDDEEKIIRLINTSSDLFLVQALFIGLKLKEPITRLSYYAFCTAIMYQNFAT